MGKSSRLLRRVRSACSDRSPSSWNRFIDSTASKALVSCKSGYWLLIHSDVLANWRANAFWACLFASFHWYPAKMANPAKMTDAMEVAMSWRFLSCFSCRSWPSRHATLASINSFCKEVAGGCLRSCWASKSQFSAIVSSRPRNSKSSLLSFCFHSRALWCHLLWLLT